MALVAYGGYPVPIKILKVIFFWYSTGRRFGYADWFTGQPDNFNEEENCVYLDYSRPSYRMFDGRCDRKIYYVCENMLKTIILNLA